MKNKYFPGLILAALMLSFSILSCSNGGTSKVTIKINLGLQNNSAFNASPGSIIDRVLSFFEKKAEAQAAPVNSAPSWVDSMTLNITADDMETITRTYPTHDEIPDVIELKVPAGEARTFELLAYTPSATLRGVAKRNLGGGSTITIPIQMGLYETKIIVPDYGNNQIVQFDENFSSSSWTSKNATNLNTSTISVTTLYPYDIDFDSQGRIYIANYNFSTDAALIRIDDINDTVPEKLASITGILSLTIDRANNLLYFAISNQVYSMRTDISATPVSLNLDDTELGDGNYGFSSIYVNNNSLYLVNQFAGTVRRLDLNLAYPNRPVDVYAGTYNSGLGDILVKGDSAYFTVYGSGTSAVVRTSLNLAENGVLQYAPGESDSFADYGPRLFVAILNSRFYLIDEDGGGTINRVVAFDDFNSPWDSFAAEDIGQTAFRFYVC